MSRNTVCSSSLGLSRAVTWWILEVSLTKLEYSNTDLTNGLQAVSLMNVDRKLYKPLRWT